MTINYLRLNTLLGWVSFAIAFVVYALTVEPTASFWDCGEFIACSYKLQVPHPPGAPFFLLLGRLFSMFSFGNVEKVALAVNFLSVFGSAFTILFMFWTISMIGRKIINKSAESLTPIEGYGLLLASLVGSLFYAFSDSFWFSAVEAEVYGMSSFFTALVVWLAFRWEQIDNESLSNRWLLLIAYMVGLSIGVHLLNLVTLPALALLYYFKKYKKTTLLGGILAFMGGLIVLTIINVGIIPGLPSMAGATEIFFVNTLGLPYNSGVIFFFLTFIGLLIWGLLYTYSQKKVVAHVALLALSFVLIGYSSYILVLVRSNFNSPINENAPSDALSFVYYLKREQYGDNKLLVGPHFMSEAKSYKKTDPIYRKQNGKYIIYDYKQFPEFESGDNMLFPRLQSRQPSHAEIYREYLNLAENEKPTFAHNLKFFLGFQVGHMYMRYFLWNFMGRESDVQDAGTLAPFSKVEFPSQILNNKAHNNYFMLPLLLGIIGLVFHFLRHEKSFIVNLFLFLMTGLALVVFVNSPPTEPRERDYIYVGSFYFFAIWVGLGVIGMAHFLERAINNSKIRLAISAGLGLVVVGLVLKQNYDDHDRSSRYFSVDFAKNILDSCDKNAILYTGGDNDTFPLWYVQEVEGYRTDVRVCNLSLLGTDWYIDQMKRKTYLSEPLPISLHRERYLNGVNDNIPFYESDNEQIKKGINAQLYVNLVNEKNPNIQVELQDGSSISTLPSAKFFLPLNKDQIKKLSFIPAEHQFSIKEGMEWTYGKKDIYKSDLLQLDMITKNSIDWNRPIYFSSTMGGTGSLGLQSYFRNEGFASRLVPYSISRSEGSDGFAYTELMYNNLMNKMRWRGMNDTQIYYNEFYTGSPVYSSRLAFLKLASELIVENQKEKAIKVIDKCLEVLPDASIPYDQVSVRFIAPLLELNEKQKAEEIAKIMEKRCVENLNYYFEKSNTTNATQYVAILKLIADIYKNYNHPEALKYENLFKQWYAKLLE